MLRDYQVGAIDQLREALKQGAKRPVIQAPTGAGKTILAAEIIRMAREKGKRVIFTVPAISLIDQTVERFRGVGIHDIGVMQGSHEMTDRHQPVQVCSVQTLARRTIPMADLVIVDECFSAGTMIATPNGEVPIEQIWPGDKVLCATGEGDVVSVSRKAAKTITVRFSNGRSVRVTGEHPFFTERGWVKAQDLGVGQNVFGEEELCALWSVNVSQGFSKRPSRGGARLGKEKVLFDILFEEARKPDEQECGSDQDARHFVANQARAYFSRRKRKAAANPAVSASARLGRGVDGGGCHTDPDVEGLGVSDELQAGLGQCGFEVGNRDRWAVSFGSEEGIGSKEGRVFTNTRVESVSRDERSGDEFVFNLHVSGHPSYFAEGVLVHNCHVMFKIYDKWMQNAAWERIPFVGLTATPWSRGMGAEGRWDKLIVCTTTQDLINRGHLSDFKTFAPSHPDLGGVKTLAGDYDLRGLGDAMDKRPLVADIVSTWLEKGENRPTICFAVNRVHAKHIQTLFQEAGVVAEYMDAYTDRHERNEIVERFQSGQTKIICNVGVLTTGFDADVRCIILARPTKSEILFVQMIGRGLRTAPGKDHCLILDHSDTTLRLGFVTDISKPDLDDGQKKASSAKSAPLPKECPKCSFLRPPKMRVCAACGFVPEAKSQVDVEEGDLHELTRDKKQKVQDWPAHKKSMFYGELLLHAFMRGYKNGWAYWAYKDRFGVAPSGSFGKRMATMIGPETEAWIRHYNIKKAKRREKTGRVA